MRQSDLTLANFILRFGPDEVLLDYAEDIVVPAFLGEHAIRTRGETTYRLHKVKLSEVGRESSGPVIALSGHFVKDTVLRRQQIFRPGEGLVEDERIMESAPSAFFVLILNNHRLLYFAETAAAPSLSSFRAAVEQRLREYWQVYTREQLERDNVTRRGVDRLTIKDVWRRIPPPVLAVVPMAGEEEITAVIKRFRRVKQIRFKLIEPNDETDPSDAIAAVERAFRPLRPKTLEMVAGDPKGLDKDQAVFTIGDVAEGQNTHIEVTGEDDAGLKITAENDEFALSVPIDDVPDNDDDLKKAMVKKYEELGDDGKIRKIPTTPIVMAKIMRLVGLL